MSRDPKWADTSGFSHIKKGLDATSTFIISFPVPPVDAGGTSGEEPSQPAEVPVSNSE
jgi:hypothetical protein